jgi:hypothetical protein
MAYMLIPMKCSIKITLRCILAKQKESLEEKNYNVKNNTQIKVKSFEFVLKSYPEVYQNPEKSLQLLMQK